MTHDPIHLLLTELAKKRRQVHYLVSIDEDDDDDWLIFFSKDCNITLKQVADACKAYGVPLDEQ